MGTERPPLRVQLVGGFLVFLTAWGLLAIVVTLRDGWAQLPVQLLVRWVLLTAVMAAGAWCLLKGIAWGYVLAFAAAIYWLYVAARLFFLITPDSDITVAVGTIIYAAVGVILLTGLLMPETRRWFMTTRRPGGQQPSAAG